MLTGLANFLGSFSCQSQNGVLGCYWIFAGEKKKKIDLDPNKIKNVIFAFWCEFAGHNPNFFFLSKLCKAKAAED